MDNRLEGCNISNHYHVKPSQIVHLAWSKHQYRFFTPSQISNYRLILGIIILYITQQTHQRMECHSLYQFYWTKLCNFKDHCLNLKENQKQKMSWIRNFNYSICKEYFSCLTYWNYRFAVYLWTFLKYFRHLIL